MEKPDTSDQQAFWLVTSLITQKRGDNRKMTTPNLIFKEVFTLLPCYDWHFRPPPPLYGVLRMYNVRSYITYPKESLKKNPYCSTIHTTILWRQEDSVKVTTKMLPGENEMTDLWTKNIELSFLRILFMIIRFIFLWNMFKTEE